MTRLSDLLRGAAERAPMSEASVSLDRARKRIGVQRGVRGVANGLAGAGAAALILVGVIRPGATADEKYGAAPEAGPNPAGGERLDDGSFSTSSMPEYGYWWGQCGSYPPDAYAYDTESGLSLRIDSEAWADIESGASIDVPVVFDSQADASVRTIGAEAAVLYQGMLVAYLPTTGVEATFDLGEGAWVDSTLTFPLVNCWDGTALPAGEYVVVVSQAFAAVTVEPTPEPTVTATPEPTFTPQPLPEPEPNPSGDAGVSTTVAPIEPPSLESRVISKGVTLTIAGDPVENPFGPYIEVWTPPALPDDALTPATARELFESAVTVGAWDMTLGTSRWIIPNYGDATAAANARLMASPSGWFGCSWDGTTGLTFPTASADLGLLDISATVPSRIHLSYGWVVDDNPVVEFSVTNTSGYSLPGFYGEPAHGLYLVKDGRVVAEAYPVNTDPYSYSPIAYMDSVRTVEEQTADELAQYWGLLAPGATTGGTYLWRDLNGCWTGERQVTISAGTYTVLTMQSIYVQSEMPVGDGSITPQKMGGDGVIAPGMAEPAPVDPATDMMIDPYYYPQYDYLELQVWTSLGSVTITTN